MRPWLFQFGPLFVPTDGRDELNTIATGLTADEFVAKCWDARLAEFGAVKKSARRIWPATTRTKQGYVLRAHQNAKVTRLPVRAAR